MNDIERRTLIGAAGIGAIAALSKAGPLTPPAGPVAPTGKTTQELFDKVAASEPRIAINATNTPGDADSLFKIGAPGSYYLTGNIQGVSGKHGIEIAGGGITLDLNGFDMVGSPGSLDGIRLTLSGQTNLTVRNGSLHLWRGCGIDLSDSAGNVSVHDINADSNTLDGIRLPDGASVVRCTSSYNGRAGFEIGNGGHVEGCLATWNELNAGIRTGSGCTISNCSASFNSGFGITTGPCSTISDCSAYDNSATGIGASTGSAISNCAAYRNATDGIGADLSAISNCAAFENARSGIDAGSGSTVVDCAAHINDVDGIYCFTRCLIRGNSCLTNGTGGNGAGIHAIGTDNRIEGNNCTGAARGIDVDLAGNIIIRNTCAGNSNNWDVVAGNVILVVNAATAAAVTGNAGGTAPGSTDPNANFTY